MAYNKLQDGVIEWHTWFTAHKHDDRSVFQQIAFLTKCMEGMFDLLALSCVETQAARKLWGEQMAKDVEKALGDDSRIIGIPLRKPE